MKSENKYNDFVIVFGITTFIVLTLLGNLKESNKGECAELKSLIQSKWETPYRANILDNKIFREEIYLEGEVPVIKNPIYKNDPSYLIYLDSKLSRCFDSQYRGYKFIGRGKTTHPFLFEDLNTNFETEDFPAEYVESGRIKELYIYYLFRAKELTVAEEPPFNILMLIDYISLITLFSILFYFPYKAIKNIWCKMLVK